MGGEALHLERGSSPATGRPGVGRARRSTTFGPPRRGPPRLGRSSLPDLSMAGRASWNRSCFGEDPPPLSSTPPPALGPLFFARGSTSSPATMVSGMWRTGPGVSVLK